MTINLKSQRHRGAPDLPPLEDRPRCDQLGCKNPRHLVGRLKDGAPAYRRVCSFHHSERTAAKHGLQYLRQVVAKNAGFSCATAYANSIHKYRKHRLKFCENIDGRLGYVCESVIRLDAQLEVDHIDGNPKNNDASNLQTLCMLCHKFKTLANKDYTTPGRKALGVA